MKPGGFTEFISTRSGTSQALQKILGITAPDFRMRDADLLLRLIAFNTRRDKYQGNLKAFLDETHDIFNRNWVDAESNVKDIADSIDEAIDFLINNMGGADLVGRRWNGKDYERSINRAILDVQVGSMISANKRNQVANLGVNLFDLTKQVCEQSRPFYEAVSGTTKSLAAVNARFSEWNNALERSLKIN